MHIGWKCFVAGSALAAAGACHRAATPAADEPVPSGPPVSFRGVVLDYLSSARLQNTGIELSFVGNANKPFAAAVTDDKGEFTFTGINAGSYMIRVGRPGYLELRTRIDARTSDQKPLDIRLRTIALTQRCVATRYHTLDCP